MRKLNWKIILAATTVMVLVGCNNPFQDDTGTAPRITAVRLYRYIEETEQVVPQSTFTIGDFVYMEIDTVDPDRDITTLVITETHVNTGNVLEAEIDLLQPEEVESTYWFLLDGVQGPAGDWKVEFQVRDAQGNRSNILERSITIRNPVQ